MPELKAQPVVSSVCVECRQGIAHDAENKRNVKVVVKPNRIHFQRIQHTVDRRVSAGLKP